MNKKLIAVAIAGAFALPVAASADNVTVYGQMHLSVDSLKDGQDRGTNVSSNASRLGFKGTEKLGNGLDAIFQVETTVNGDGGASGGTFTSQRDTFVGLKGGFGTVRLGFFDTPTKQLSRKLDLFNNQIGDTRNLLRSNGTANAWDERFRNGIRYDTPKFSGFSAAVHYSAQTNVQAANNNDRDAYSVGANYENGPFMVGVAYQRNNLPGTAAGEETNWRLGGSVNFNNFVVNALYQDADDQNGVSGADRKIYGLGAGYKMGANTIKGQFYKAKDLSGSSDTGAKLWAVGFDHNLSKRTTAYVAYAKTSNDNNAQFSMMGGGGHGDDLGARAPGQDPSGISIGMIHKF